MMNLIKLLDQTVIRKDYQPYQRQNLIVLKLDVETQKERKYFN